jgi:hypothetical protein
MQASFYLLLNYFGGIMCLSAISQSVIEGSVAPITKKKTSLVFLQDLEQKQGCL